MFTYLKLFIYFPKGDYFYSIKFVLFYDIISKITVIIHVKSNIKSSWEALLLPVCMIWYYILEEYI